MSTSTEIQPAKSPTLARNEKETDLESLFRNLKTIQTIGKTYERAMEEKQIDELARIHSIRQTAFVSVLFFVVLQVGGVAFFMVKGDMSIADAALVSAYAVTSAGFGSVLIPKTTGFMIFITIYVYIGISTLAVMVSAEHRNTQTFVHFITLGRLSLCQKAFSLTALIPSIKHSLPRPINTSRS